MGRAQTGVPLVAALLLAGAALATGDARTSAASSCGPRFSTEAYSSSIQRAIDSGPDLWGSRLLASRSGPTLAAAQRFLTPLLLATQRRQRPLTPSGFYYVPLSFGFSSYGPAVFALHVADGSEIITRHIGGPSLSVYVGDGRERYGSCTGRLHPARLAEGYLPIVQTSYVDARGVKYTQESFVGRAYGARSVVSFVQAPRRRAQCARRRKRPARAVEAPRAHGSGPAGVQGRDRLIVGEGAEFVARRRAVSRRTGRRGDRLRRLAQRAVRGGRRSTPMLPTYDATRTTVVGYWTTRLTSGMQIDVPEPAVRNAALGILGQVLAFGWRYSVGNPYEELSFAEALDAAEVAAEYGFPNVAKAILQVSLQRLKEKPKRFTAFRAGHLLSDRRPLLPPDPRSGVHRAGNARARPAGTPDPQPPGSSAGRPADVWLRSACRPTSPEDVDSVNGADCRLAGPPRHGARLGRHGAPRHRGARTRARAQHWVGAALGAAQGGPAPPGRVALRARRAERAERRPVHPADRIARRLVLEPRHALRPRLRLLPGALARCPRARPLRAGARLAPARRAARGRAHHLLQQAVRLRAR